MTVITVHDTYTFRKMFNIILVEAQLGTYSIINPRGQYLRIIIIYFVYFL